jgi:hypothetical protein
MIAAPPLTIGAALGFVTLAAAGGCTSGGVCADPAGPQYSSRTATLAVQPGERLTVRITEAWSEAPTAAFVAPSRALTLKRAGELRYTLALAHKLPPQRYLAVFGRWAAGKESGDAIYYARLLTALPVRVASTATLTADGRVRWTIRCPKQAGARCAGLASLRKNGQTVVRESYADLAPGASRTFRSEPRVRVRRGLLEARVGRERSTVRLR